MQLTEVMKSCRVPASLSHGICSGSDHSLLIIMLYMKAHMFSYNDILICLHNNSISQYFKLLILKNKDPIWVLPFLCLCS